MDCGVPLRQHALHFQQLLLLLLHQSAQHIITAQDRQSHCPQRPATDCTQLTWMQYMVLRCLWMQQQHARLLVTVRILHGNCAHTHTHTHSLSLTHTTQTHSTLTPPPHPTHTPHTASQAYVCGNKPLGLICTTTKHDTTWRNIQHSAT